MKRRAFRAGLGIATPLPSLAPARQAKRRIGVLMAYAEGEPESRDASARLLQEADAVLE